MNGSDKKDAVTMAKSRLRKDKPMQEPEWANGLKQLYDSVVDEPLPDAFRDLLAKLDGAGDEKGGGRK